MITGISCGVYKPGHNMEVICTLSSKHYREHRGFDRHGALVEWWH